MRGRPHPVAVAVLASLAASFAASAAPGHDGRAWVRFDDPSSLASARPIVASDVPGDATLGALSVADGMLRVEGALGVARGSRWSTLGAEIAPEDIEAGADLGGAAVLRIRLASAVARPLRVRIKGSDREIGNAGCYPVVVQMVTAAPADYVMPLSAFRAPGWCGTRAPTIAQTLRAVQRVEVTANDEPEGAVSFAVGRIEFLAEDAQEREPDHRLAGKRDDAPVDLAPPAARAVTLASPPASSAAPAPRRRVAAAGPPPSAPAPTASRRVVCEFSARYQLMLCY
ncbi:MAG: hypothetical protein ACJ8IK_19515 [Burkholderiaceae bacterium]